VQQKATTPIIAVAVVVLIGIVVLLFKMFGGPPAAGNAKTSPLPDFIDPVTHKPKVGVRGSSTGATGGRPTGPPPGPSAPGGSGG